MEHCKTMNVIVKNPTKPYSLPPYTQETTDKRVSSFLLQKTSYISMKHRKSGMFGARERRDVTHLHIGLRGQRSPQGRDGAHNGARCANVSI